MEQHFVRFYSPGTLVAEQTQKTIDSWDIEKAKQIAKDITERYGAKPYGFCFVTRQRDDDELDSKEVKKSGMYYLGGEIVTLEDLKRKNDPDDKILISNMEYNDWNEIVRNQNSWSWTQPLKEGDTVLNNN